MIKSRLSRPRPWSPGGVERQPQITFRQAQAMRASMKGSRWDGRRLLSHST